MRQAALAGSLNAASRIFLDIGNTQSRLRFFGISVFDSASFCYLLDL